MNKRIEMIPPKDPVIYEDEILWLMQALAERNQRIGKLSMKQAHFKQFYIPTKLLHNKDFLYDMMHFYKYGCYPEGA